MGERRHPRRRHLAAVGQDRAGRERRQSTKTLGVRITPSRSPTRCGSRSTPTTQDKLLHRTSYTVGLQTTVLANAAKFVPNFVSRTINKYLAQS